MAISSVSDYLASLRERPPFTKVAARASASGSLSTNGWSTLWDATGIPAAGTLAVGNTANGVVPTDATTGAPTITFSSGSGYLTEVEVSSTSSSTGVTSGRYALYDRLFHAGAYAFNAATSLASQPSFSSRVPGGSYCGLQLWIEVVTSFTGIPAFTITYTDQDGNAGATTGSYAPFPAAPTIGTMRQMPLAEGDTGLQKVESVTATVASAGTFNVLVVRPLALLRIGEFPDGATAGAYQKNRVWLDRLGMPLIFSDSCVVAMYRTQQYGSGSGPATPTVDFSIEIASL